MHVSRAVSRECTDNNQSRFSPEACHSGTPFPVQGYYTKSPPNFYRSVSDLSWQKAAFKLTSWICSKATAPDSVSESWEALKEILAAEQIPHLKAHAHAELCSHSACSKALLLGYPPRPPVIPVLYKVLKHATLLWKHLSLEAKEQHWMTE